MPTPIADAFVRLRPDVSGFRQEVVASVGATLDRIGGGAGITTALDKQGKALEGIGVAGLSAAAGQSAYNAAVRAGGVDLSKAAAGNREVAAAQEQVRAGLPGLVSGLLASSQAFRTTANESNLFRGALIGLSRITPVAVFGLGIIGTAAIAAGLAIRATIRDAAQFEQSLNVFQAVSQATAEQMEAVGDEARALGRDTRLPSVSAADAATAMTELAKAGLTVEESMDAARGVLELATAAEISVGEAAEVTASTLNAFALAGTEAAHVADLLAAASIAAQGSITDMAAALKQAQAVAANANISVEDTVAAISLLAKNGLLGSDAGTSLRTTILRLVPTTKEAAQFQKALGVETATTTGELEDLAVISEQYRVALSDLSEVQQQAALQQIFGQDAIRAATIFAREGAEGFNEAREATSRQGAAADIAAAKSKGLAGAWRGLQSNAQTLATTIGGIFVPALTDLVRGLSAAVEAVNLLTDAFRELTRVEIPEKIDLPDLPGLPGEIDIPVIGGERAFSVLRRVGAEVNPATQGFRRIGQASDLAKRGIDAFTESSEEAAAKIARDTRPRVEQLVESLERIDKLGTITAGIEVLIPETMPQPEEFRFEPDVSAAANLERTIRGQLRLLSNLGAEAFEQEGEAARAELNRQIDGLIKLGAAGQAALADIARPAARFLGESLRRSVQEEIVPNLRVEPLISTEMRKEIARLAALGPPGKAQLRQLGTDIQEAIAEGIEQSNRVVEAAEQALEDAIAGMQEAIRESVKSARSNLESLGTDLASQVGQAIDAMPFGIPPLQKQIIRIELQSDVREAEQALREAQQRGLSGAALQPFIDNVNDTRVALEQLNKAGTASVETLQRALDSLEARLQRRQLQFSVRQASRELRDAQQEIAAVSHVGFQTPAQRQAIGEILDPFREGLAQAQGDLRSFDLSQQIAAFELLQEKAKKAAEEGIARLIDDFQKGRISADKFEQALRQRLGPILDSFKKKFGTNLGFTFTQNFLRTFEALVTQARLLTGFLSILGTEPGKNVVDSNKVVSEQRKQVAQARQNLQDSINAQKKTAENTTAQVKLLGLILAALQAPQGKPLTQPQINRGFLQAERLTGIDIPGVGS